MAEHRKSNNNHQTRPPVTKERIMNAAVELADHSGIAAVTMRRLAEHLGVEAMSLYNHVANKEQILDGVVDMVLGEISLPEADEEWRSAMRRRAHSARDVFSRHPWALSVIETRSAPGSASIRYYDAVLGCLRRSGFSIAGAGHVFAVLDAYIFGFALQEQSLPFETVEDRSEIAAHIFHYFPSTDYPYFAEFITEHALEPGYSFAAEFDVGLELILSGLEELRQQA